MMNHIWYTFHIPSVRNHPDMILEHYNIAALPLFNVIYIRGPVSYTHLTLPTILRV